MRFPEPFIQEVIERTDIEELVGRYVELKRSGSNLVGRCPFHSEKTPSFSVSPQKKMFFCFGCHAGGTAITFVQKAENLDFTDAVEFLANRAGLPLPRESEQYQTAAGVSRKRVLEMNLEAAKFFRACLFDSNIGAQGMDYFCRDRGLSVATVKHFGLGFAPDSFGSLTDHMHRLGYSDEELIAACLCGKSPRTGRVYDYFRNRVIFPIIDSSGNVVAFGGRVLDDSKPKYLNSSDTPAFKKSKQLFALNFAKNSCAERMILCEGYMDVIALHAAGFEYAVATLGTAITPDHARIFSKYTQKVIISYDSDEAGQNAANKAMRILGEVGMEVRVLKLSDAKDPDEYIKKFGADAFRRALSESRTGFDHKAEQIYYKYDLAQGSDKIRASNDICKLISEYWSAVEREVYLSSASERLQLPVDVLKNTVEGMRQRKKREAAQKLGQKAQADLKGFGDRINPDAAKDPRAAAAEETIIGLLMIYDEYRDLIERGDVALVSEDFVTDFNRRVFEALMCGHASEAGLQPALLGAEFTPDEMGRIERAEMARRQLSNNGIEVLRSAVAVLKDAAGRDAQKSDLKGRLEYLRAKKAGQKKGNTEHHEKE